MSKLARRHRRRRKFKKNPSSSPKRNPPLATDLLEWVAPGFAGFAATRLVTRLAQQQIAKRWPKVGKHAGAVASLSSFLASWFLGGRWSLTQRYHTPITVGAAIAAAQSLLQIYAPKMLGWMVSDASSHVAPAIAAAPAPKALPPHLEEIDDDPRWYTYNDAYDTGRYGTLSKGTSWQPEIASPDAQPSAIDDPQAGDDELAAGIFGGN